MLAISLPILYNTVPGNYVPLGKRSKIYVISRDEEIPGTRSLWVLNFVQRCLIIAVFSFIFKYGHQFTCTEQKAPNNSDAQRSLQNFRC
jgi:hypothetical protein